MFWGIGNSPNWAVEKGPYLKQLVNQLGINTLDLTDFAGDIENTQDWFTPLNITANNGGLYRIYRDNPINDDADPNHFNCADQTLVNCPNSFPLAQNDWIMEHYWIGPEGMRAVVLARGETPHLMFSYNNVVPANSYMVTSPEEFAEQIAAVFIHDRNKYGMVPDIVQTLNEPDGAGPWNVANAAASLAAAKTRLAALGFRPQFWCCTAESASNAVSWYEGVKGILGPGQIDGLTFHLYGGGAADLQNIAATAKADGIPAIMTEVDYANIGTLFGIMNGSSASGFMRFIDGSEADWGGVGSCGYLAVTSASPYMSQYILGNEGGCNSSEPAYFFPQFSNYVGEGSVREQAAIANSGGRYEALAYRGPTGQHTVIVHVMASLASMIATHISNTVTVTGVPAGTYGCTYTFDNSSLLVPCGANQSIGAGGQLSVTLPYPTAARGTTTAVVTFFGIQ